MKLLYLILAITVFSSSVFANEPTNSQNRRIHDLNDLEYHQSIGKKIIGVSLISVGGLFASSGILFGGHAINLRDTEWFPVLGFVSMTTLVVGAGTITGGIFTIRSAKNLGNTISVIPTVNSNNEAFGFQITGTW